MRLMRLAAVMMAMVGIFDGGVYAEATTRPVSVFDPARHMRVSEVKAGMKGYGLSVFKGVKIEKFGVEVLSVLRNFNPQYDVFLVRLSGADLEHTGSIAGMSGSPIYLTDEKGRTRMAGAFAYGWPMTKDPIGGVQPIEYMLQLPEGKPDGSEGTVTLKDVSGQEQPAEKRYGWSLAEAIPLTHRGYTGMNFGGTESHAEGMGLRPLATPMMVSGLSSGMMADFAPGFRAAGMEVMQAGGAAGGEGEKPDVKLEPGSVLAVPLMTGDLNLVAIGTCTEVIGQRIFGFGHAMNNEGAVVLPMGSGLINGIIPNIQTSFKIGEMTQVRGVLNADQTVGVAGRQGVTAPTVPVDLHLTYTDGSIDKRFHFDAALHPKLTPMLASVAVAASLTGGRELPQYNTLVYDLKLEFESGQTLRLNDTAVNTSAGEIFFVIGLPLMAASENPFARVAIKHISGELKVSTGAKSAQLLSAVVPKMKYKPGEMLRAYITYRPFRQAESVMPVNFEMPKDLPEGAYQLRISGWEGYMEDEELTKPFRFKADSAREMFDALRDVAAVKHTDVYLRLLRQADGVAIGRTAMPALPSSRRQVLLESGRSDLTPFVSSTTKRIATEYVVDGSADFTIEIEPEGKNSSKHLEPKGFVLPPRQEAPDAGMNGEPAAKKKLADPGEG